ncbi:hypothetical protein EB796_023446 [Bugula neritina]|uniref:Uncharacterized protein n=1 Tax=Bugula neritina TaxID=10212 RepID=A0A7J7IWN0_BUGNE|nr:hypothetical protein EB796_023446 [Bugula neritina]
MTGSQKTLVRFLMTLGSMPKTPEESWLVPGWYQLSFINKPNGLICPLSTRNISNMPRTGKLQALCLLKDLISAFYSTPD